MKDVPCGQCGRKFKTQYDVEMHAAAAHGGEQPLHIAAAKPHQCVDCKRRFTSEEGLSSHRHVAHGSERTVSQNPRKELPCPGCNRWFGHWMALAAHASTAHDMEIEIPKGKAAIHYVTPVCIECGSAPGLVTGERIYPHRRDLYALNFYLCDCGAYVGCHKGTTDALGHPCNAETRSARSQAHKEFDLIWKNKGMSRTEAYAWLANQLNLPASQCHIGMMDAATAQRVAAICAAFLIVPTPI